MNLLFKRFVVGFWRREGGAAASEYAISLSLIAAAIAIAVSQFDLTAIFPALVGKIAALIN